MFTVLLANFGVSYTVVQLGKIWRRSEENVPPISTDWQFEAAIAPVIRD